MGMEGLHQLEEFIKGMGTDMHDLITEKNRGLSQGPPRPKRQPRRADSGTIY